VSGAVFLTLCLACDVVDRPLVYGTPAFLIANAFMLHAILAKKRKQLGAEQEARREAEERMRESQERFAGVFRSSPVWITLSRLPDGRLAEVNPAALEILGYDREEFIDRSMQDVGVWASPGERERLIETVRLKGRMKSVELRFRKKSGAIGTLLGSGELVHLSGEDYLLGMGIDITERKRTEENLRASEERFKRYFELGLIGMILSSPTRTLEVNDEACKMLGYERSEILSMTWAQVTHPDDLPKSFAYANRLLSGEVDGYTLDKRFIRKDGKIIYVTISAKCIRGRDGSIDYIVSLVQDITKRKKAEEKLGATLRNLRKAMRGTIQAIVQVVEVRDPFTAGHQRRVADLARSIATEMRLPPDVIEGLRMAAAIHDIGKVSIPAEILSKPGKLTPHEFDLIKDHAQMGYDILKEVEFPWPIAEIVLQHHERIDGSGYPRGLKGEETLIEAKIIAVADVVEAIASHRPFRPGQEIEAAIEEIEGNRKTLYDAATVDTCVKLFREKGYVLTDRSALPASSFQTPDPAIAT
jgi:PAS domain S-box-containing protein/putative nucleotidyltransferase with HDIG domain